MSQTAEKTVLNTANHAYPQVDANPDFAERELDILEFWKREGIFERSVEQRPACKADDTSNQFVFYDGPPFANGLPHYGHLLTGFVKDVFPRYQTMKGRRVERRFGWDCHGLPAEMGTEKELGISGRQAIEAYGIEKFNARCRVDVMKYTHEWERYVNRQARWVDFENDYKTMDVTFMESVMWAFKQLFDKGWVYEGYRVMPYSWAAETPLSNFETRMDNAYRSKTSKAITVAFELEEAPEALKSAGITQASILAWTTTPWTLPSNLALAASPKLDYAAVEKDGKVYLLEAQALAAGYQKEGWTQVATVPGEQLLGLRYKPLFPYFAERSAADAVLTTERLFLRPFTEADYPRYRSLQIDPNIAATTSDGVLPEEKIRSEFDRFLVDQASKGFSQWAVFRASDGVFIGRAGFDNRDYDQFNTSGRAAVELRYALLSAYWGQGYAGEAASALLNWGAKHLSVDLVIAGCNPTYVPAVKLLKKLGFESHHEVPFRDQSVLYHTLELAPFRAKAPAAMPQVGAFRILDGSSFIEEGSGTGIVHMAPGFGEDDQRVCEEAGIQLVCPVDDAGRYTGEIFDLPDLRLNGLNVMADTRKDEQEPYKDEQLTKYGLANLRIVKWLKDKDHLLREEDYTHNYPHCWRTDTPLIYKAVPSWYVKVTAFRDRMVELNQQINWIPGHVKDGLFGKWLENAHDWSISRNRFWGAPIPVWKSDDPKNKKLYVFGSISELEQFFNVKVEDLHRPFIDHLTAPDPENPAHTLRRVSEVLDCWFESGSMPFAQIHYPFENKDAFEKNFPADFIVEYTGQTRGWFYTLMVLGTALFDKPPFKNCICHGVVLDAAGKKLSKSLRNYPDPTELFQKFGADALRWFMMSSPIMRGQELHIDKEGAFIRDAVRLYLKPLWNAYNFFTLYANADGMHGRMITHSPDFMDSYILCKLRESVSAVEAAMDAFDTPTACTEITQFLDVLNNWYIRRSKERFWKSEKDADKQAAYDTLYTVLHVVARTAAPLLPMLSEEIYQGLTNSGRRSSDASVHLTDWPDVNALPQDHALVAEMDRVRDACNAALAIRNQVNIRVRQPLARLTLIGVGEALKPQSIALIQDEVNVKECSLLPASEVASYADLRLQLNSSILGKKLGGAFKEVLAAAKAGQWKQTPAGLEVAGTLLEGDEYSLKLEPKEAYKEALAPLSGMDGLVLLDLTLTDALKAEGYARDMVRFIQQARKDAGLNITDRIALKLELPEALQGALADHRDYIMEQTLTTALELGRAEGGFTSRPSIEGHDVGIALKVAA